MKEANNNQRKTATQQKGAPTPGRAPYHLPLLQPLVAKSPPAPLKTKRSHSDAIFTRLEARNRLASKNYLAKGNKSLMRKATASSKQVALPKFELHEKDIRSRLVTDWFCSKPKQVQPLVLVSHKKEVRVAFIENFLRQMERTHAAKKRAGFFCAVSLADANFQVLEELRQQVDLVILELSGQALAKKNEFSTPRLKRWLQNCHLQKNNCTIIVSMDRDQVTQAKNGRYIKIRIVPHSGSKVLEKRPTNTDTVKIEQIAQVVAKHFGLPIETLFAPNSNRETVLATQCAMYLAIFWTDLKKSAIGLFFKRMNHTTVLHAEKKIRQMILKDSKMARHMNQIVQDF